MAKLTGIEHIRDAIGAFNSGETNIADLERLIGTALATGSVSRLDASRVIRADCKPGAAASDIIDNLGLDEVAALDLPAAASTPERPAARPAPERPATHPNARAAQETRLRITGMPVANRTAMAQAPAQRAPAAASTDRLAGKLADRQSDRLVDRPADGLAEGLAEGLAVGAAGGTDALWADPEPVAAAAKGSPNDRGMLGKLLGGRYLLERELGRGGMGEVYLASDQEVVGELFAIKVLKPEIRAYPEALPLLREEVRTTRALRHPNIVGVYSLNSDRNDIYMLMEYLEGKTLDALLDQEFGRGMPFSRAWPLILDMCDALAYAHDHSVIHSDLKPSNVFVTLAGRAKLLDFGIARVARTRNGRFDPSTVGALTLAYASCEMLEGGKPDQSDDVFALACVIYEMLSGRHPFDLRSALEARAEGYKVTPIPLLAPSQNAALAQALAFGRGKRTSTVEALLAGLEPTSQPAAAGRAADATSVRARRTTTTPQAPRTVPPAAAPRGSRSPAMITGLAAVAAILVGGVALLLYRGREQSPAPAIAAAKRTVAAPAPSAPPAIPPYVVPHAVSEAAPAPPAAATPVAADRPTAAEKATLGAHRVAEPPTADAASTAVAPTVAATHTHAGALTAAASPTGAPTPAAASTPSVSQAAAKAPVAPPAASPKPAVVPPPVPSVAATAPASAAPQAASLTAAAAVPPTAPAPPTAATSLPPATATQVPLGPPTATAALPPIAAAHAQAAAPTRAAAVPSTVAASTPTAAAPAVNLSTASADYSEARVRPDAAAVPPVGKHVSPVKPLPDAESSIESCPYPDQALHQGHTGSVGLLVYIAPDGGPQNIKVDESSGSDELDEAAARCVQDYGRFSPKLVGSRAQGYWGHMRLNFSFGG
jgi:TonB family protein